MHVHCRSQYTTLRFSMAMIAYGFSQHTWQWPGSDEHGGGAKQGKDSFSWTMNMKVYSQDCQELAGPKQTDNKQGWLAGWAVSRKVGLGLVFLLTLEEGWFPFVDWTYPCRRCWFYSYSFGNEEVRQDVLQKCKPNMLHSCTENHG